MHVDFAGMNVWTSLAFDDRRHVCLDNSCDELPA